MVEVVWLMDVILKPVLSTEGSAFTFGSRKLDGPLTIHHSPAERQIVKRDTKAGKVYLVGAGPGDPGLLTLKGRECLRRADVVIYDRLAHPDLLNHCKPGVEKVFAGKEASHHTLRQDEINAILVEAARNGKTVCRLKGGVPF